jgi:hypothetical protein
MGSRARQKVPVSYEFMASLMVGDKVRLVPVPIKAVDDEGPCRPSPFRADPYQQLLYAADRRQRRPHHPADNHPLPGSRSFGAPDRRG